MNKVLMSAALSLAVMAGAAQAETIRVGMSGGYFPFTYTENGKLQGFELDVLNAIGEKTGDDIEFVTMSFSGLVGALGAKRIDTIANQITITPEREKAFVFSQPYVYDGAQIVTRKGNTDITGPDSLSGKTVAVNLGSNYEQLLRELPNAKDINIKTYETAFEQDVALGRVDAFVMDRVSSAQTIKQTGQPLQLAGAPFSEIKNALPFRKDEAGTKLRDKVDAALTELAADGTLTKISEKWFGTDITKPVTEAAAPAAAPATTEAPAAAPAPAAPAATNAPAAPATAPTN